MAVIKIFAALFVICVSQAGVLGDENVPSEYNVNGTQVFSMRSNPFECLSHVPSAYQVLQEIQDLWRDFFSIMEDTAALKIVCERQSEEWPSKEACIREADETYADRVAYLVKKAQPTLVEALNLGFKLKECVFGSLQ